MSPPSHVCIFTSAHPVDDVRVNSKFAASFLEHGFRVSWVGPEKANFTENTRPDPRIDYHLVATPRNRVERLRVPAWIAHKAKDVAPVTWWYAPDPDSAAAAVRVARRHGGRVLFDIHEVFHEAYLDRWLGGRRLPAVRELVRRRISWVCRHADLVVGMDESVLRPYVSPSDRTVVVRSCAPRWFARDELTSERRSGVGRTRDQMTVMHGKIVPTNGTTVVVEALAKALCETDRIAMVMTDPPDADPEFLQTIRQRIADLGIARAVTVHPRVPHDEMPGLLAGCDVGMIAYGPGLGGYSLPNRFFEYMAAGLAVLAPSYSPEIRTILEQERIGVTADFSDPADVARALVWLREHPSERRAMGQRAREAFLRRHNWDSEFERLLASMERVTPHA